MYPVAQDLISGQTRLFLLIQNMAAPARPCPGLALFLSSTMMKRCTFHYHRTHSTLTDILQSRELISCSSERSDMLTQQDLPSGKLQISPNSYDLGAQLPLLPPP